MTLLQALLLTWLEMAFPVLFLTWVIVDGIRLPHERAAAIRWGVLLAVASPVLYAIGLLIMMVETAARLRRRA